MSAERFEQAAAMIYQPSSRSIDRGCATLSGGVEVYAWRASDGCESVLTFRERYPAGTTIGDFVDPFLCGGFRVRLDPECSDRIPGADSPQITEP